MNPIRKNRCTRATAAFAAAALALSLPALAGLQITEYDSDLVLGTRSDPTSDSATSGTRARELATALPPEAMLSGNPEFANPCPGPTTFTGTHGVAQAGKRNFVAANRVFRDAVPSTCGGKACPGNIAGASFNYDVWEFDRATTGQCVTVQHTNSTCPTSGTFWAHPWSVCGDYPQSTAWPTNCTPAPNVFYLGDPGSTPSPNIPGAYSFCVPANIDFSIVVGGVGSAATTTGCNYSFTITCAAQNCPANANCGAAPPPPGGTCDLTPIEAKLDMLETKADALEAKADASAAAVAALEAKIDSLSTVISQMEAAHCEIIRLLLTPQGTRTTEFCGLSGWNEDPE